MNRNKNKKTVRDHKQEKAENIALKNQFAEEARRKREELQQRIIQEAPTKGVLSHLPST